MRESPPIIQNEVLTYRQDDSTVQVSVGSARWYAWLQTASRFTFRSGRGSFTARKERAGNRRGAPYWRAYQKRGGKLHRAYLGQSGELTLERLQSVAAVLASKGEGEGSLDVPGLGAGTRLAAEPSSRASTHRRRATAAPGPVNVKRILSRALLAKLSHLLANQSVRTVSPASVNSAESENSPLP